MNTAAHLLWYGLVMPLGCVMAAVDYAMWHLTRRG